VSVTLDIDRLRLPQDASLVFRGSIEVDGVPLWKSDPQPVDLTSQTIDLGSVMLRAVEEPDMTDVNAPVESALAGTWVVEDILGGGIIDRSRITLEFSERRVAGNASCNSYQGAWSLVDEQLSIVDVAVTMKACPEAIMNQERRFLDALAAADGIRVDDTGALFLTSGGNDLLLARRER
jgi:heat shock protein HslJ